MYQTFDHGEYATFIGSSNLNEWQLHRIQGACEQIDKFKGTSASSRNDGRNYFERRKDQLKKLGVVVIAPLKFFRWPYDGLSPYSGAPIEPRMLGCDAFLCLDIKADTAREVPYQLIPVVFGELFKVKRLRKLT